MKRTDEDLTCVRPSPRQLVWQDLDMYAFIHFGMNTMTDREWGMGHEDPALFHPDSLDVQQWMEALVSAGMTGVILTCKHHDGFCLWPSAYTSHSVASSPWKGGKGDLVREVSDAAREHGLKFGVYLSPWDRTEESYGTEAYNDFYIHQLTELLTGYGEVFSVWLDGACGEGANGKRQVYDWERIYATVRELQPRAVISVCGPDVRWCGNEAGHTRADEWSVVPEIVRRAETTAERSQKVDDGTFSRYIASSEDDLGSRKALDEYSGALVWYPAEVNTSIRPGWFYHAEEDTCVRSANELFDIWCASVGGNASFLLNVPPDSHGRIAVSDKEVLAELGTKIRDFYRREVILDALDVTFEIPQLIEAVILREDIRFGQRIESVKIYADEAKEPLASCQSVGNRRIWRIPARRLSRVRVDIEQARGEVHLKSCSIVVASP
ncbi:alpha-L-fucosidase [Alloscardovia macacae]|uniref:alpha-L-fucosidase n=1 Tax=Alloscardovia macacae TaxID=1160091 RepID=A0A261F5N4_9BIFI|nr:alpha-L-fucosidase [Alloscardovia macacae]OZG54343.1 alpha-L-fucosidase [Alloscardovia macacae]